MHKSRGQKQMKCVMQNECKQKIEVPHSGLATAVNQCPDWFEEGVSNELRVHLQTAAAQDVLLNKLLRQKNAGQAEKGFANAFAPQSIRWMAVFLFFPKNHISMFMVFFRCSLFLIFKSK